MVDAKPDSLPAETIAYAQQFFGAARRGDVDALRPPLESGLPVNLQNSNGDSLVRCTAPSLLSRRSDEFDCNQLMLACYNGKIEATKLLLTHGANPNILNDRQQSCLSGAIFKNETEIIQLLLDHLADPDVGDPSGAKACEIFGRGSLWDEAFAVVREKIKAKAV